MPWYVAGKHPHPRTAMATIRHSRIELTMNYSTNPVLLDVDRGDDRTAGFRI